MRRDDPGPFSLDLLAAMPIPALFTMDASVWKERLVQWFEAQTGRVLYPMQVEMLLIETLSYAMATLGAEGQMVAEQHLVAKAGIEGLERLGPNRSTLRLPASPALTTLRFSIAQVRAQSVVIPAGTIARAGSAEFATMNTASIPAGALQVNVAAAAVVSGMQANGFIAGQITAANTPEAGVNAANITTSGGGADIEDEELYRLRLANAFERISTGGSQAWYRETAIGVSAAIIDVAIVRPQPCYVDIYPLTAAGAAALDLRNAVKAAFNTADALDIRFGDEVTVKPPVAVTGSPIVTVRGRGMPATIQADATASAQAVIAGWRERLGAAVAPSDIDASIKALTGVIDVEVSGLPFEQLDPFEYFMATSLTVNVVVLP